MLLERWSYLASSTKNRMVLFSIIGLKGKLKSQFENIFSEEFWDLAISDTAFQRQVLWSLVTSVEANFAKCLTDFFEKLHLPLYKSRLLEGTVLQGQRMTLIRTTTQKIILERQYIFKITKKTNSMFYWACSKFLTQTKEWWQLMSFWCLYR